MQKFYIDKLLEVLKHNPLVQFINPQLTNKIEAVNKDKPILIAIAGESGVGKTVLLQLIQKYLPGAAYLSTDQYFTDFSTQIKLHGSFDDLLAAGYDLQAPFSIHLDVLRENLIDLKQAKDVLIPYHPLDDTGTTILNKTPLRCANLVFADGYCTLYENVRDLFDFVIYLDTDETHKQLMFDKLQNERGRSKEQSQKIYKILKTSSAVYIEPTKQFADIVLDVFKAPVEQEEDLIKDVIRCFGNQEIQAADLYQKVLNPKGDLKALMDALPESLKKQIRKVLKTKY